MEGIRLLVSVILISHHNNLLFGCMNALGFESNDFVFISLGKGKLMDFQACAPLVHFQVGVDWALIQ